MPNNKQTKIAQKAFNTPARKQISQHTREVSRYLIFEMLIKQPKVTASDIAQSLKLPISAAWQQLKALEQINIIEKETSGKKAYYKFKADNAVAQAITKY